MGSASRKYQHIKRENCFVNARCVCECVIWRQFQLFFFFLLPFVLLKVLWDGDTVHHHQPLTARKRHKVQVPRGLERRWHSESEGKALVLLSIASLPQQTKGETESTEPSGDAQTNQNVTIWQLDRRYVSSWRPQSSEPGGTCDKMPSKRLKIEKKLLLQCWQTQA